MILLDFDDDNFVPENEVTLSRLPGVEGLPPSAPLRPLLLARLCVESSEGIVKRKLVEVEEEKGGKKRCLYSRQGHAFINRGQSTDDTGIGCWVMLLNMR